MQMKQLFFNALTICTLALAVLMAQAVLDTTAIAQKQSGESTGDSLRQRVADLESQQKENDSEFVLIDQSLADLDLRVNANDGRLIVHGAKIRGLRARVREINKKLARVPMIAKAPGRPNGK